MRARLTISISEIAFFFHTVCDMEITDGKVKISFLEEGYNQTIHNTIGISENKALVVRKRVPKNLHTEPSETFFVVSNESIRTKRVGIDLNGMPLFLFADGMKIEILENGVIAEIKCYITPEEKETEEYLLKFECYAT